MAHHLPPLNALKIFEVAARAASFTEAAQELHLTHGAISRQIRLLEEALGQPLFRRDGQRMVATAHAKAFAREVSAAFDHISDASRRYGKLASQKVVRVNAPATLAMRWLIPRLDSFRTAFPGVDVRVSTAFSNEPALKGSFDLIIRRAPGDASQYEVFPLFQEFNTVIVSPALVKKKMARRDLRRFLSASAHLSTETRPGDWEAWLTAAGILDLQPVQHLRFDHFFVTLQAVVDGMGIGIGSVPTLQSDLDLGRLVAPFDDIRVPGNSYYALLPRDVDKPKHLRAFHEWLVGAAMS